MKSATDFTEMSDYIDLEMYHKYEKQHPGYLDMIEEMAKNVEKRSKKSEVPLRILEIGAGTGLFTERLSQIPNCNITAIEPDKNCFSWLCVHLEKMGATRNTRCLQEDGVTFRGGEKYDVIVSTFSHHHIAYEKSEAFVQNLYFNLIKDGGVYIMGDELTASFSNETERKKALREYHHHIITLAEEEGNYEVAKLEYDALLSGIRLIGDHKRSVSMLEKEIVGGGLFRIQKKKRVSLLRQLEEGGIYIYFFEKQGV